MCIDYGPAAIEAVFHAELKMHKGKGLLLYQ